MIVYRRYVTPVTSVRIGDRRFNSFCGKTDKCLKHFARLILRYFRNVPILIRPLKKVISLCWWTEVSSFTAHCSLHALTYTTRTARRRSHKIAVHWHGAWNDLKIEALYFSIHYLHLVVNLSVKRHHSIFERMVTIIQKIFSSHLNILYGPRFVVLLNRISRKTSITLQWTK
jgi:hypothetical protein